MYGHVLRNDAEHQKTTTMFKSIGIAAFGTAIGVPLIGVVAGAAALVAVGAVAGYVIGGGTIAGAGIGAAIAAA